MTPATDDDALEAAFEALLAGRSASPAAGGLAAFADGVRATAARPPRPSAALAELLATGLLTDQSSVPAPRAAARSRRRSTRMFLAFFTKLAAAGVAAKAAVVGGVVVVGLSTAGFADALPAPAQHAFATVVDAATPLTAPDTTTTTTAVVDAPTAPQQAVTAPVVTAPEGTTPAETPTAPKAPTLPSQSQGLGGVVSGMAHDGTITPGAVSSLAHKRNEDRRAATGGTATTDPTTGDDSGEAGDDSGKTTTTTTTVTEDSGHGGSSSGSKGKGHGNG